ncbi:hypothetical protein DFJ73DRAFT_904577 [Zopfochytrium polystomum]|nr:hypothetical protein DFJ73DRAFT_904577 [Zopfochytrium polystomum]
MPRRRTRRPKKPSAAAAEAAPPAAAVQQQRNKRPSTGGYIFRALSRMAADAGGKNSSSNGGGGGGGGASVVATADFDEAVRRCKDKVAYISRVCRARNSLFRDPYFDVQKSEDECLYGIATEEDDSFSPSAAKRVRKIFRDPKVFVDGVEPGDIVQGGDGDCWFLAACSVLCNKPALLRRLFVARDEEVGVYGFVFFRDGQWVSVVVDDQLFVTSPDYGRFEYAGLVKEKDYVEGFLRGSNALYFAKCKAENETWLPLLEKAYAKIHGDYEAISGGTGGEGVEATSWTPTGFWREELLRVNVDRLFFCSLIGMESTKDIIAGHEYGVLKAVEVKGRRFLKIRNPWGKAEWTGPWADGSSEWTPEWMQLLDHKFGDDGIFWMEYKDFLNEWYQVDRAILFDETWSLAKQFLEVQATVPASYSDYVFDIVVNKPGPVYVVLSQIDSRYFRGLEGRYQFSLNFRMLKVTTTAVPNDPETGKPRPPVEHETFHSQPVRSTFSYMYRSIFVEIGNLAPGKYRVYPKVYASLEKEETRDAVIRATESGKLEKLERMMESFLLAKSKAVAERVLATKRFEERIAAEKAAAEDESAAGESPKKKSAATDKPSNGAKKDKDAAKSKTDAADASNGSKKAKPAEDEDDAEEGEDGDDGEEDGDGEGEEEVGEDEEEEDEEEDAEVDEEEEESAFQDLSVSLLLRVYSKDPSATVATNVVRSLGDVLASSSGAAAAPGESAAGSPTSPGAGAVGASELLRPDYADPNADMRMTYHSFLLAEGLKDAATIGSVMQDKMKLAVAK